MNSQIKVQASIGNVFADLELENSEELLVKAELARRTSQLKWEAQSQELNLWVNHTGNDQDSSPDQ